MKRVKKLCKIVQKLAE